MAVPTEREEKPTIFTTGDIDFDNPEVLKMLETCGVDPTGVTGVEGKRKEKNEGE
eukprot:gnl/Chilomastix_caulleri/6586.p4 GENE.gnl/Chilomastix_caulleri/6586~~gnl/Chilomastix_caulleri/6586.p4  ORF type:complete len:55 (+),score=29.51 gnl/Chilomastix_caulleri/6586:220-384(+)